MTEASKAVSDRSYTLVLRDGVFECNEEDIPIISQAELLKEFVNGEYDDDDRTIPLPMATKENWRIIYEFMKYHNKYPFANTDETRFHVIRMQRFAHDPWDMAFFNALWESSVETTMTKLESLGNEISYLCYDDMARAIACYIAWILKYHIVKRFDDEWGANHNEEINLDEYTHLERTMDTVYINDEHDDNKKKVANASGFTFKYLEEHMGISYNPDTGEVEKTSVETDTSDDVEMRESEYSAGAGSDGRESADVVI